jgi:hypothetical protein
MARLIYNLKALDNVVHSNSVEYVNKASTSAEGEEYVRSAQWRSRTRTMLEEVWWIEPHLCAAQSIFVQQRMGSGFREQEKCFWNGSGGRV